VALAEAEVGHKTRVVAVVGSAKAATEQDGAAVIVANAHDLVRVLRQRCIVEGNQHQPTMRQDSKGWRAKASASSRGSTVELVGIVHAPLWVVQRFLHGVGDIEVEVQGQLFERLQDR